MSVHNNANIFNFSRDPVDICMLTFSTDEENDHFDLISRCLNSIVEKTDPIMYRLHIGCNNLSKRAMSYVDGLVCEYNAVKYIGKEFHDINGNIIYPKYPLMRRMYAATHEDWVIWFDDDVYVTERDWLEKLEETINRVRDADQFGIPSAIALPCSVKEEWIDVATWSRPGKVQYLETPAGRKITAPFIWGGFYALSRRTIQACDIPDRRLFHNYGDWTTGMALHHNDFKIAEFKYGVVSVEAPRRGIHDDVGLSSKDRMVAKEQVENNVNMFRWEKIPASQPSASGKGKSSPQQELPERFSTTNLEKNMAAMDRVKRDMTRRICLPVDGSHIHFLQNGEARYERHRTLLPLVVGEKDLAASIGDVEVTNDVFLFGIGLGEQLDYVLQYFKEAKITAWDRDPWLIRLVLMQKDYSDELLSGRLKLGMGADLIDWAKMAEITSVVYHPFLLSIYHNEYQLVENGVGERRAIICSGELFVDDVTRALTDRNYTLYTLDIKKLAIEEMAETIKRFDPQFVFAINYTNGLVELCHKLGPPLICWEIDPAADSIKPCKSPTDRSYIFTHRKANVEEFLAAGFQHVSHLPLASDPKKRSIPLFSEPEQALYGSPLSFVGSSMVEQARSFQNIFLASFRAYRGKNPHAIEEGNRLLEKVLKLQRNDFSTYRIPDLLAQFFGDFVDYMLALPDGHNPFMFVGKIAAAEKRINYIARLAHLGLKVWGDEGWRNLEQYGAKYMGSAGHTHEINKIYNASLINVDVNRLYQPDIVTMRVFDVMACGGFILAEYSRDLDDLFDIGTEVEAYHTPGELLTKSAYYLKHTEEALSIAKRGQEAVCKNHTIAKRVEYMLNVAGLDNRLPSRTTSASNL